MAKEKQVKRRSVKLTASERKRRAELARKADNDPDAHRRGRELNKELDVRRAEFSDVMTALKATREKKGLSLTALSEKSDINKASLSLLENGKGNPTLETVKRIADALGAKIQITVEV